jgi:hypothetical protein
MIVSIVWSLERYSYNACEVFGLGAKKKYLQASASDCNWSSPPLQLLEVRRRKSISGKCACRQIDNRAMHALCGWAASMSLDDIGVWHWHIQLL